MIFCSCAPCSLRAFHATLLQNIHIIAERLVIWWKVVALRFKNALTCSHAWLLKSLNWYTELSKHLEHAQCPL